MRDFDEHNITQAVIDRFAATPDPRLKRVMTSLVSHLHDFIRDIEPSFAEWQAAVGYLTRTGQMCDDKRQEFILLSDTLGASMLVDAINHRMPAGATETTVLGPFFIDGAAAFANGADLAKGVEGETLFVEATVMSAAGAPLAGATVDVWQSDAEGFYDVQRPERDEHALRGRLRTDAAGKIRYCVAPATRQSWLKSRTISILAGGRIMARSHYCRLARIPARFRPTGSCLNWPKLKKRLLTGWYGERHTQTQNVCSQIKLRIRCLAAFWLCLGASFLFTGMDCL
jgi:hypothetical protein